MPDISYIIAHAGTHRRELIELNVEYLSWVFAGIESYFGVPALQVVGMSAAEYVPTVIDKVSGDVPPVGTFYLISVDGQWAGMGGLRRLRPDCAEIKRLYLRPQFRGMKLGDALLNRLLTDARSFGYACVLLDTGPFMTAAHRLYERHGFVDCEAYAGVEVPAAFHDRWRFMGRSLKG